MVRFVTGKNNRHLLLLLLLLHDEACVYCSFALLLMVADITGAFIVPFVFPPRCVSKG